MVVSVSDTLGSIAATNLGVDGTPMIVTSVPPEEVRFGRAFFPLRRIFAVQENVGILHVIVLFKSWFGRRFKLWSGARTYGI